ncbi:MAG TPA: pyridoxal-phosphate dependent enzyme [Steroidobacteraceae bacterium]|jgi:Threonine dehydratase|nr:pyridoxal-phosphate dependent enzyme [Steroidobacteraceae bacterium]
MKHRLSIQHIVAASEAIDPAFRDTPQFEAETLREQLGCRLIVKVETLNPIRSFKARGAQFLVSQLSGSPHLVCATAGNFGQGMAYAARKRGWPITIFVGANANPMKVERMRQLGATVRAGSDDPDELHAEAAAFAHEHGAHLVQDGREAPIAEGAGTIAVELLRWPKCFDDIVVPLGDGALLGGMARWVKAQCPTTRMIGVCATASPAMERSWRSKRVVSAPCSNTIAAGIVVGTPFEEAVTDLTGLIDDVLLVPDSTLISAMRLAHRELGLVLEPAGAAGLAALLDHREQFKGRLVATVLTGGNVDPRNLKEWLSG